MRAVRDLQVHLTAERARSEQLHMQLQSARDEADQAFLLLERQEHELRQARAHVDTRQAYNCFAPLRCCHVCCAGLG